MITIHVGEKMVLHILVGIVLILSGMVVDSFTTRLLEGDNPQSPNAVREFTAIALLIVGEATIVLAILW